MQKIATNLKCVAKKSKLIDTFSTDAIIRVKRRNDVYEQYRKSDKSK